MHGVNAAEWHHSSTAKIAKAMENPNPTFAAGCWASHHLSNIMCLHGRIFRTNRIIHLIISI